MWGIVGIFRKNKMKKAPSPKMSLLDKCKLVGRYKHHNVPNESKEIFLKLVWIVMNFMIQACFTVEGFTVYLESLDNNGVYVSPPICIFRLIFSGNTISYPII